MNNNRFHILQHVQNYVELCGEIAILTFFDVKNSINRMNICTVVPMEPLRKAMPLPPSVNITTRNKNVLSPVVDPSVRQTLVSIDLNSQHPLFNEYSTIPTANTATCMTKTDVNCMINSKKLTSPI